MNSKTLKKIRKTIKEARTIALFCHVDPDFDAYASMFGLGLALKSKGKKVQMFTHEGMDSNQKALFDESLTKVGDFKPQHFDLLISVDTPDEGRLGIYGDDFAKHNNTIKIDHHPEVEKMAKIELVDPNFSSCAEIVAKLLSYLKIAITPNLATILFAGLVADTNSFTNTNVNVRSFENGLNLVKRGADIIKVNNASSRMQSMTRYKLNKVFFRNFQIVGKQIAVSTISHRELLAAQAEKRDTGGFSNQLLNYNGVNIACMIVEREPHIFDLSFRSMSGYDVSKIAATLNGGGHKEAAGATLAAEDCKEAKKVVLKAIKTYLKERKADE